MGRVKNAAFWAAECVSQPPVSLRPLGWFPHLDGGDGSAGRVRGDQLLPWAATGWGWGAVSNCQDASVGAGAADLRTQQGLARFPRGLDSRTSGPRGPPCVTGSRSR